MGQKKACFSWCMAKINSWMDFVAVDGVARQNQAPWQVAFLCVSLPTQKPPPTMKDRLIRRAARADYAANFRKIRERDSHTQLSLSYAMDTHQAVVNRIENCKKKIDMDVINDFAEVLKKAPEEVFRELNGGLTVHSAIETNHGNGVNVQQADLESQKNLYERLLEEKDKYIRLLERQLGVNG
jgi:ribosome-binding protein aMBF1 (putative translation factor)